MPRHGHGGHAGGGRRADGRDQAVHAVAGQGKRLKSADEKRARVVYGQMQPGVYPAFAMSVTSDSSFGIVMAAAAFKPAGTLLTAQQLAACCNQSLSVTRCVLDWAVAHGLGSVHRKPELHCSETIYTLNEVTTLIGTSTTKRSAYLIDTPEALRVFCAGRRVWIGKALHGSRRLHSVTEL